MRYLLIAAIVAFGINSGSTPDQHEVQLSLIRKDINSLRSDLSEKEVSAFSRAVLRNAIYRDLSPRLILAIIFVESTFRKSVSSVTRDHGPMQVNEYWLDRLNVTKEELNTISGGIEVGSYILSMARTDGQDGVCWWSTYNSINVQKRHKYEVIVRRTLGRLGEWIDCSGVNTKELLTFNSWSHTR